MTLRYLNLVEKEEYVWAHTEAQANVFIISSYLDTALATKATVSLVKLGGWPAH